MRNVETIEDYKFRDTDNSEDYPIQIRYFYLDSEYDPIDDVLFESLNQTYHGPFDDDEKLSTMLN